MQNLVKTKRYRAAWVTDNGTRSLTAQTQDQDGPPPVASEDSLVLSLWRAKVADLLFQPVESLGQSLQLLRSLCTVLSAQKGAAELAEKAAITRFSYTSKGGNTSTDSDMTLTLVNLATTRGSRLALDQRTTSAPVLNACAARNLSGTRETLHSTVNGSTEKHNISARITIASAAERVLRTKIPCYVTYVRFTLKEALLIAMATILQEQMRDQQSLVLVRWVGSTTAQRKTPQQRPSQSWSTT